MQEKKLTMAELSRLTGVSRFDIQRVRDRQNTIGIDSIMKIAVGMQTEPPSMISFSAKKPETIEKEYERLNSAYKDGRIKHL